MSFGIINPRKDLRRFCPRVNYDDIKDCVVWGTQIVSCQKVFHTFVFKLTINGMKQQYVDSCCAKAHKEIAPTYTQLSAKSNYKIRNQCYMNSLIFLVGKRILGNIRRFLLTE